MSFYMIMLVSHSVVKNNNQGTLKLTINLIYHTKTKYIEIEYHFILKKMLQEVIEITEIKSKDSVVYIFTKSLSKG